MPGEQQVNTPTPVVADSDAVSQEQDPKQSQAQPSRDDVFSLQKQMLALDKRFEAIEERLDIFEAGSKQSPEFVDQPANMGKVAESLRQLEEPVSNEDWFWAQDSEDETSLSFGDTEGFSVNSVVCRSEWCRVEVEDLNEGSGSLISDLELQIRIDKSLGRDTIMYSGVRDGKRRVLFIK